jgi:threonine dehydrogenase-like Zn-dependent dehydrogenase
MKNKQLYTTWGNREKNSLKTVLRERELPKLKVGDILVKVLYVPIHGSFWLAADPSFVHPRKREFMANGGFVFGNGGVGQVIDSLEIPNEVSIGDYVSIFGHTPCKNYNCYSCYVTHRYTECDFNEGGIIGHGKDSIDGTYAEYVILPRYSYEVIYKKQEQPSTEKLKSAMFSFLLADVRNALTRQPDVLRSQNMLLVGAGYSGILAAYVFLKSSPESRIYAVDSDQDRLTSLMDAFSDKKVEVKLIPESISNMLVGNIAETGFRRRLADFIDEMSGDMKCFFNGQRANVVFDASSSNTSPIWDNGKVLSPGTFVLPFGFSSEYILLTKDLIQCSGLSITMSRGVGNIRNRKETVNLLKNGADKFIERNLINSSNICRGIDEAYDFINRSFNKDNVIVSRHNYIEFDKSS